MYRLRGISRGGRLLVALAVGGAVFGIATAVQASIPDANGVIHGCYAKAGNPSQGALRVSDSGACKPTENPLSWSQTGVSGPTGPTGPTGPAGTARAWARISSSGTILHQVNVTGVNHISTGVYCVTLDATIDVSQVAALATVFQGTGAREVASTAPRGCGVQAVQVNIWSTSTNLLEDDPFSLMIP